MENVLFCKRTRWIEKFFFFLILILDKFVLNKGINRRMSYFVGILSEDGDIFLPGCPKLFLLNVGSKDTFEPHISPLQRGESCYK